MTSKDNPILTPGVSVGNLGEPIHLSDVNLIGIAAESSLPGQQAKIWTRLALTSDDRGFHRIADGIAGGIEHLAQQSGKFVEIMRANMVVLVIRPDKSGELWVDTAATGLNIMAKRSVEAGQPIFEHDIADIRAMWFPALNIAPTDRIVVLFRERWAFGLLFDMDPDRTLDIDWASTTLGRMYRSLRYRNLYEALSDSSTFEQVVASGWFPFVEIFRAEFQDLVSHCQAGFDLDGLEAALVEKFKGERLDHMVTRWAGKPQLANALPLLESAARNFKAGDPIATIKIAVTEIEGVLRSTYQPTGRSRPKIDALLQSAIDAAARKAGSRDSLLLPEAFAHYLRSYTFAQFDPSRGLGNAGSRHAVGHGAAKAESYTMARALQALLTIDQLAFYI